MLLIPIVDAFKKIVRSQNERKINKNNTFCGSNGNNWTFECKMARIFDPKIYNPGNEFKMDAQSVKITRYLTVKLCKRLFTSLVEPNFF